MRRTLLPLLALFVFVGTASASLPHKAKDIAKHLRSADYETDIGDELITATHEKHLNMVVKEYNEGVFLQSYFDTEDWDITALKFIELVNQLNAKSTVARYYIDKDNDVMVEAWFAGDYDKDRFDTFLDAWHGDTSGQYTLIKQYLNPDD